MAQLLRAAGAEWELEIVGKLPELPPFLSSTPSTEVYVEGPLDELSVIDRATQELRPQNGRSALEPFLFEAVRYEIYFEAKDGSAQITLPGGAEFRSRRGETEHYAIDFGANVGFFEILIKAPSGVTRLKLEVFSRKIDYRSDYIAIRQDVSGILRNLAMAANAKTFGLSSPAWDSKPTLIEWFASLRAHFDEFIKLSTAITKFPHASLNRHQHMVEVGKARRVGRHAIARAMRGVQAGPLLPSLGLPFPKKVVESISRQTFDNHENRYFKAVLLTTLRNLKALARLRETQDEDGDKGSEQKYFESILPEVLAMERRIEALLRAPFLKEVGEGPASRPPSMVLNKDPLYSRFDKAARLVNSGLAFSGDIVPIGVKDLALLYEYWCFLKIVEILRKEKYSLVDQTVVQVNRFRTVVTLRKGKQSAVRFQHETTGATLYVIYNRLFGGLPTTNQKPDNVIQIASDEKFYILDAKYRLKFDRKYTQQYGGPGPHAEDINTMHRYRDAIAIPHPTKAGKYKRGVVEGAVVLFPMIDEDRYKKHKFYKSIPSVGIGGLPFLPGATTLVEEKLVRLLTSVLPDSTSDME